MNCNAFGGFAATVDSLIRVAAKIAHNNYKYFKRPHLSDELGRAFCFFHLKAVTLCQMKKKAQLNFFPSILSVLKQWSPHWRIIRNWTLVYFWIFNSFLTLTRERLTQHSRMRKAFLSADTHCGGYTYASQNLENIPPLASFRPLRGRCSHISWSLKARIPRIVNTIHLLQIHTKIWRFSLSSLRYLVPRPRVRVRR